MPDPLDALRACLPTGYTIERPIASGGQGTVFLGRRAGQVVALKLFVGADPERLRREIELLLTVVHPNLVKFIDFEIITVQGQKVPLVAYELVEGDNLRTLIGRGHRPAPVDVLRLGVQVGDAVEELWSRRVVHRDIKPENVIAALDGNFILVDVGFAQHLDLSTITQGGNPGTTGYRSPEQCGGRSRLTVHSDVFSLGVTLYEFAAGRHPWDRQQVMMARTPPPLLAALRPDLDMRLPPLIHQMMAARPGTRPNDPGKRFANIGGP